MHFLRPEWFYLLIPVTVVFVFAIVLKHKRERAYGFIDPHLYSHIVFQQRRTSFGNPLILLFAIWLLIVLALTGPTWKKQPSPFAEDYAPIWILLDVGKSMDAEDVLPSRLARAKIKIQELLNARKGGSTGLVVYSGTQHLVMPLTKDTSIVKSLSEAISTDIMPVQGEVIHHALIATQERIQQSEQAASIVIISDGIVSDIQGDSDGGVGKNKDRNTQPLSAEFSVATQILYISDTNVVDSSTSAFARSINAPIIKNTVDHTDVERLVKRANVKYGVMDKKVGLQRGDSWIDFGYILVFPATLLAIFFCRRGWKIIS